MNERQKKIMVPYEEPTDTCPDCSEHPCDCGLPAGYQSDIRFAANFAPHIKVMEASKVAEIIEQRNEWGTVGKDGGRYCSHQRRERWIKAVPLKTSEELERELTAVTAQRDALAESLWNMLNQEHGAAIKAGILLRSLGLQSLNQNSQDDRPNGSV